MAVVPRSQASAILSTGLSAATVALNVAGAAADAVPIAKQILNSAAHISAAAERIQKKREAMYLLVEKADIYATQIDIAVAGRILDHSLERRLARLYSVFLKIEALVDAKAGSKNNALTRVWRNVVTKPNRAEALVVELEREIQLFQLLAGIQLSLVVDDTARAVAADAKYDGQFRILRDCDIEKLDVIRKHKTDEGVVVWASARVKRQLMVIRYLESQPNAESNAVTTFKSSSQSWDAYLENIKTVSTVHGSHPHIVQLYGQHARGPAAVFRSGTSPLWRTLLVLRTVEDNDEAVALKHLRLAYKILDASLHLAEVHGLAWVGNAATVDENGEPRIGLFDDIVRANPKELLHTPATVYNTIIGHFYKNWNIWNEETGVVEQVHNSYLKTVIMEQLRDGYDTDRLRQVWNTIRQEQLCVDYDMMEFPIVSGNLSLPQEMIARAQRYFETSTDNEDPHRPSVVNVTRHVLLRGTDMASRMLIFFSRSLTGDSSYIIYVGTLICDDTYIRHTWVYIYIPAGPLLAAVARAVGLPADFEDTWTDDSEATIYRVELRREDPEKFGDSGTSEGLPVGDESGIVEDEHEGDDVDECDDSEEESDGYETAEEGEETAC